MGVFSIIQKHKMHHSNIYSGAPMPFMQRITWSGVAMHAGVLPGYPASHGCIRMPMAFAQKMWNWTKMGARVIVTPGEITPASFLASAAGRPEGRAASPTTLKRRRLDAPLGRQERTRAPMPGPCSTPACETAPKQASNCDRRSATVRRRTRGSDPHRRRQQRDDVNAAVPTMSGCGTVADQPRPRRMQS